MKILLIDDEIILSNSVAKKLEQNGYHVDIANSFQEYKNFTPSKYSAFIVDISLGDGSGLDIVKELRNTYQILAPILIVSGHESTSIKVEGLDIGADDYITKPFAPDELMARLRSIFRREGGSNEINTSNIIRYKDISFNLSSREVKKGEKEIDFTKKEKQIVEFFLFHKNELISKRQLIESLWNTKDCDYVTDNTINVTIYKVRKKLGDNFKLETKVAEGYILIEE